MTIENIKNAGYKIFKTGNHSYDIYVDFAYHGLILIEGSKKYFKVTMVEDCPLYDVKIEVKTVDDIAECLKKYFPVDSSDNRYYDMYNVQIRDIYRVDSFVYGIVKKYGFKSDGMSKYDEGIMSYVCPIGNKRNLGLDVDTKSFKLRAFFGEFSWAEAEFKMWDEKSLEDALAQVLLVPVLSEVGNGFSLLAKLPVQTKTASINSSETSMIRLLGGKPDDIRKTLESARANIDQLLATI